MSYNKPLNQLLLDFLEYLEVEKQVSQYTIRNYSLYMRRFVEWFVQSYPGLVVNDIDLKKIAKYRSYLSRMTDAKGKVIGKATQSYHVIALRSWFKWMAKNDIEIMAPEKIDLPKSESKRLVFLNMEQVERLLTQPRVSTIIGLRDRAMLEVFFSTGVRVSELASLDRDHVNTQQREFSVLGKGRKLRVVFLSDRAALWLERYLTTRMDHWSPVFVRYSRDKASITSDGEQMRLTVRSMQRLVKKYGRRAGITVPITPHGLRHSFATDLLSKGAGLREVQEMLGHKNVATTQIYTHVTNPQLRKVHEKYHSGND